MTPDIYQYDDFRAYLKACFESKVESEARAAQKSGRPSRYSQRKFALEAGFTNPGYFNDVLKGYKSLSKNALQRMAAVFGLKANEMEFLKLLTDFGQAKISDDRQRLYKQILSRRNRSRFVRLNPAQSRYYQDIRYGLVRGAIEVLDFRGNYEQLADFLKPAIPVSTVKDLVRDLCEWELVRQGSDGRYRTTRAIVEPSPHLIGMSRNMNSEWLKAGREALHRLPPEERHVSTMILNISEQLHEELSEMIERFREEIFRKVENDGKAQRIQQLTMVYVPRSSSLKKKKES